MNKKILILMTGVAFVTTNTAFAMLDDKSSENSAHTLRVPRVSEVPDSQGRMPGTPNYGNPIF